MTIHERRLLPGLEPRRGPVRLHELDLLAAHALERSAARIFKGRASQARRVDGKLRPNDAPLRTRQSFPELAEKRLRSPFKRTSAVRIASVEEDTWAIAASDCGVEGCSQIGVCGLVVAPEQPAPPARVEPAVSSLREGFDARQFLTARLGISALRY